MFDKRYICMFERTLTASSFHAIGLQSRKLHVWTEVTGFGLEDHEKAKWRQFAPAELLGMATLKVLKDHTGVAISGQASLINFLAQRSFSEEVLRIWRSVQIPILTSDLENQHTVSNGPYAPLRAPSPFLCSLSLEMPVSVTLAAMESYGNEEQKRLAIGLRSERDQSEIAASETEEEEHQHVHLTNAP